MWKQCSPTYFQQIDTHAVGCVVGERPRGEEKRQRVCQIENESWLPGRLQLKRSFSQRLWSDAKTEYLQRDEQVDSKFAISLSTARVTCFSSTEATLFNARCIHTLIHRFYFLTFRVRCSNCAYTYQTILSYSTRNLFLHFALRKNISTQRISQPVCRIDQIVSNYHRSIIDQFQHRGIITILKNN